MLRLLVVSLISCLGQFGRRGMGETKLPPKRPNEFFIASFPLAISCFVKKIERLEWVTGESKVSLGYNSTFYRHYTYCKVEEESNSLQGIRIYSTNIEGNLFKFLVLKSLLSELKKSEIWQKKLKIEWLDACPGNFALFWGIFTNESKFILVNKF